MIRLSRLTLGYGGQPVLELPGMEMAQGSQWLVTGPSGCGKTTLLYALAGLTSVMDGSIAIDGVDIATLSPAARDRFRGRHIGMIFQTLHLVKSLTVMQNLLLASYVVGLPQDEAAAEEALKQLDIHGKKDDLPESLSQGQAQRVAIARAVLHHPLLILADEPTSSLDDRSCETVIQLIRDAAKQANATLIVSTHDSRVKAHFPQAISLGSAP